MRKLPLVFIFTFVFFSSTSVVKSSHLLAQEEKINNEKFEYIIPEQSLFCTDFPLSYDSGEKTVDNSLGEGEGWDSSKPGEIWLEKDETKQPDFSFMENRLNLVFSKVMPLRLNEQVNINPEKFKLNTRAKHFIINEENYAEESCPMEGVCIPGLAEGSIPETNFVLPEWWTDLLGTTKIFCGLFGNCTPPEKLALLIEQPNIEEISENINELVNTECVNLDERIVSEKPLIDDIQKEFNFWAKFRRWLEELTNQDSTKTIITKEKREAQLTNKTRGLLVGGETLISQSDFFSGFISHGINSSIEKNPVQSEAKYGSSLEIDSPESEKHHYQEQNQTRTRNCLQLCSLYPPDSKFDVSLLDPTCKSCDPKDYKIE